MRLVALKLTVKTAVSSVRSSHSSRRICRLLFTLLSALHTVRGKRQTEQEVQPGDTRERCSCLEKGRQYKLRGLVARAQQLGRQPAAFLGALVHWRALSFASLGALLCSLCGPVHVLCPLVVCTRWEATGRPAYCPATTPVTRPGPLSSFAMASTHLEAADSSAADEHPIGLGADGHAGDGGILYNDTHSQTKWHAFRALFGGTTPFSSSCCTEVIRHTSQIEISLHLLTTQG